MGKLVDMSKYDALFDNLEEYVNEQGCTLGEDADRLQKLVYSIQYCYLHGVLTDNQVRQANEKFTKQFQKALYEMQEENMFKPGQWIYGIEVEEDYYDEAEVNGYLFMAECGDYIICCSEYMHHEDDFKSQLNEMYEESIENQGIDVYLLRKDLCFATENEANDYLDELINEDN